VTFSTAPLGGVHVAGRQAYAGSEAAPQFAPGSFFGFLNGNPDIPSALIFSVPEEST
jgi:hypothetical protein